MILENLPAVGEKMRRRVLLRHVEECTSRRGQKYLNCDVVCPAGAFKAVVWEHVDALLDCIKVPQLIEADLSANEQGYSFSNIEPLTEENFDPWDFMARTPCDEEELWERTVELLDTAVQSDYGQALLKDLLADEEFVSLYQRAPAALSVHHNYRGGLMEHVLNGLEMLPPLVERYDLDLEIATLGFWLHDIGKLWEIDLLSGRYSREGELIGHLSMGMSWLESRIDKVEDFPTEKRTELLHILVSHHGSLEKGSPRAPMTGEAVLVHTLDQLDSEMFQLDRDLKHVSEDAFSHRNPLLARKFYRSTKTPRQS